MPTALRTYLFTDLIGFGRFLSRDGDAAAARLLRAYRKVVQGQLPGPPTATLQEVTADTIYVTFRLPEDAIQAALAIAGAVHDHNRSHPEIPIRVGIGIHAGQAIREGRDFVGTAVAVAARMSHAAQPGQILTSATVLGLLRTSGVAPMRDLGVWGPHELGQSLHVFEVVTPDREGAPDRQLPSRREVLAIVFTDIVRSTDLEAALGDREWAALVERHHATVRAQLDRYEGLEVDTAGDGFFAVFDAPSQAIQCSYAIQAAMRDIGLDVRVGIHVGECEIIAGKVGGIAVVIAARTREAAQPGEILVSQTVRDVVSGGPFVFTAPRVRPLKGIPGRWRLYKAVADSTRAEGPS